MAERAASPPVPPSHPAPDQTGLLLLTSGTTGRPKAVMETLRGCWAKMQFFADALAPGPDDVHLLFLPMAHVFGLRLSLIALLSGGRLVLLDRFAPAEALRVVTEERVTILPGMPTHFTLLLDALDAGTSDAAAYDVGDLRWAVSAAATFPRPLVERIYDRLGTEIHCVYGCSENFTTQTTDREDILAGSVGREVFEAPTGEPPDGTIRVVRPDDHAPLPVGEAGELAFGARGPVHYWKAPDAATDGWYYTGDLGRIDEDGRVYVLGRLKELVNRGGLKVSPPRSRSRSPDAGRRWVLKSPSHLGYLATLRSVLPSAVMVHCYRSRPPAAGGPPSPRRRARRRPAPRRPRLCRRRPPRRRPRPPRPRPRPRHRHRLRPPTTTSTSTTSTLPPTTTSSTSTTVAPTMTSSSPPRWP